MKIPRQIAVFIMFFMAGVLVSVGLLRLDRIAGVDEKVNVNSSAKRVITFSPAAAEVIYAIGADDKLVAVSGFCNYPEQVKEKPKVGDSIYPNFEKMAAMNPDLVIMMGENDKISEFCRGKNIQVIRLSMFDVKSLFADIETLGEKLGAQSAASKLMNKIDIKLEAVSQKVAGLERPGVFLSFFRSDNSLTGLSTVGGGTHLDNLIEIAGGENIFADEKISFPKISKETLLKLLPEVIIEPRSLDDISSDDLQRFRQQWQVMNQLPAVKNNRIYFPDADVVLKPGPRIGQAAEMLARMIHPEAFEN